MNKAIITLTFYSRARILREGGTGDWRLNRRVARHCEYAVCVRNAHDPRLNRNESPEPHGLAFMIGRIRDVVPGPNHPGRWLVSLSEYADIEVPDVWEALGGGQNPIRYATLDALGIDPAALDWHPMPSAPMPPAPVEIEGLSISQAKPLLARHYGTAPENVEITIRG